MLRNKKWLIVNGKWLMVIEIPSRKFQAPNPNLRTQFKKLIISINSIIQKPLSNNN